jgi:redox-sensitive bicupin YhaK (pirin superfamily)
MPPPTRRDTLRALGAASLWAALPSCQGGRRRHAGDVRVVTQVVTATGHTDGAGVKLRKSLGGRALPMLDPFLMLDELRSADAADFQAGFPSHPHRGFETVTVTCSRVTSNTPTARATTVNIHDGGAQWMTAGRGIIHSEMPQLGATACCGGLQLWINLPARSKWIAPRYQDLEPGAVPSGALGDGSVRVVAGQVATRGGVLRGPIDGIVTAPTMFDATLPAGARLEHALPGDHAAFVYALDGELQIGDGAGTSVAAGQLAALGPGPRLVLGGAGGRGGRALVLAAAPIGEPVARRGPFVMTTQAELQQAYADYRAGRLVDG